MYKFKPYEDFEEGEICEVSQKITKESIQTFAEISGDRNPLHLDEEFAKKTRFKGTVAHGILTAGVVSALIVKMVGVGSIFLGANLRFTAPVRPGDTVTAHGEVVKKRHDKPILTLRTDCYNQDGTKVIEGECTVMVASQG